MLRSFIFLLLFLPILFFGQTLDSSLLSLERIFRDREFSPESFGPSQWLEEGKSFTTLEPSLGKSGGTDIVEYLSKTGKRTVLVPAEWLIPAIGMPPLEIADYQWSADMNQLLIFTNTQKVWRDHTRGDYWVLDRTSRKLTQIGKNLRPSSLMFAKFSPDGSRVAYVRENNLYVEQISDGRVTPLTLDGSATIINGTFDWAYEEELSLQDGFRWSPDGLNIAFWQLNVSGVRDFYIVNNTDSLYPQIHSIPYPKVGEQNAAAKVGVVSVRGGKITWMEVDGDPRNHYLARLDWINEGEILLQQLNRKQNRNRVMVGNIASGEVKNLFIEKDSAWVELMDDIVWAEKGKTFLWLSERDGWRHVWRVSLNNGNLQCLTPADYDVEKIVGVDPKGGWFYYIASPENPNQRYIFRTPLNGTGIAEGISPSSQPGTHSYDVSPDGQYAIHTWSAMGEPPMAELVSLPDHQTVSVWATNETLRQKLSALKTGETRYFNVRTRDGADMDGWYIQPPDFDPTKKYPVLFYVYGEPWVQTAKDVWGGNRYLWHLMLSQMGYVVMTVDNRGTPSLKGRDWRKIVYGQIGILASDDQADAVREVSSWDWVDAKKIAIWGWSGGGSMTLNMMFRYPELYHTGMSVAPVADQRLYDAIYQERYMGLLAENPEGYRLGSPVTFAQNLKGNLLLVHGTGDDNVHYQNTEILINELIRRNRPFDMMAYPNRTHSISEGAGTSYHLYGLLTRYLTQHIPPGKN
ncbi:MAG: S9 family peptidase [Bacteroidia bacterium]|nr:S9 family peptidase [Bacteroidia bacterium]